MGPGQEVQGIVDAPGARDIQIESGPGTTSTVEGSGHREGSLPPMQRAYVPKYVIGGLAVVVLVGLLVWLIRSEGERTRQTIRDARRDGEPRPQAIPQETPGDTARPANTPDPAARDVVSSTSEPDQPKPAVAPAADPRPAVVERRTPADEDFSLDDHVVFPGLANEVAKTRTRPGVTPQRRDRTKN